MRAAGQAAWRASCGFRLLSTLVLACSSRPSLAYLIADASSQRGQVEAHARQHERLRGEGSGAVPIYNMPLLQGLCCGK